MGFDLFFITDDNNYNKNLSSVSTPLTLIEMTYNLHHRLKKKG
jgi:hypothetical protein